jgi:nicotinamidase-related amidase
MSTNFGLERNKAALLVIDVQDKLFNQVDRACEVMLAIQKTIKGFQILNLPILLSEQYPKGLGPTIATLKALFEEDHEYLEKTTFSCLKNAAIKERIQEIKADQWILVGIEAHVCVLQTAKDLLRMGMKVVVLNDAITSRSVYEFSTAIAELRDCGARISSSETILFELLGDSQADEFKEMSNLIKKG